MRPNVFAIPGQTYGKWTVLKEWMKSRQGKAQWLSVCSCGTFSIVHDCHLRLGNTKSCRNCAMRTHGLTKTPTWRSWQSMIDRCNNPKHPSYAAYSTRKICDSWSKFDNFLADMGIRPKGETLDRIDNSLGYFKENCRWATPKDQANNMSSNMIVEYKGEKYTCSQLADHLGMEYHTLYMRIKNGKKLDAPVRPRKKKQK